MGRLRQHDQQPVLRQLLHRGRHHHLRQPDHHEQVDRRRRHLVRADVTVRHTLRARRPAAGATQRDRRGALLRQRLGHSLVHLDQRRLQLELQRADRHRLSDHVPAGGLRSGAGLPTAEIDAAGTVYVAWQDCRFRSGCPANDIVYSTSSNGTTWSTVARVPIDATTSGVDHFIPGIGVDRATSGSSAHIGLYYYFYPTANCTSATCQLTVGYVSSVNGGSTWSAPQTVGGPMSLSRIASTTQGSMVGDYISCSITGGKAVAIFAIGKTPSNGQAFDEAMYTAGGLSITGGTIRAQNTTATPSHTTATALTRR
jgi:hypothetical protein